MAPVLIYLDQNKWIELARIVHGRDTSQRSIDLLDRLKQGIDAGKIALPLSGVHYMELARISDAGRRSRLGAVMYDLSKGVRLAWPRVIIEHELEVALARRLPAVVPVPFELLGRGVAHALGLPPELAAAVADQELDRAILMGDPELGIDPAKMQSTEHRQRFLNHLVELESIRTALPRAQWRDALCAISMVDIMGSLNSMLDRHPIRKEEIGALGQEVLTQFLDEMPTRRVDIHLHTQVLKNAQYRPKLSDLEDWAGLAVASCYCDLVICEKHMASMLTSDQYVPASRIATDLAEAVAVID